MSPRKRSGAGIGGPQWTLPLFVLGMAISATPHLEWDGLGGALMGAAIASAYWKFGWWQG